MQFNSWIFLVLFLPFTIFLYFFLNKWKNNKIATIFLIVANLLFYTYAGADYMIYFLFCILINFLICKNLLKEKNKIIFIAGLFFNIGMLLYLKYTNFLISSINSVFLTDYNLMKLFLPLGLSFFVFQFIALIYDCYKGKIIELDFLTYFVYISYFPKIIQGPIMTYQSFEKQYNIKHKNIYNSEHVTYGFICFVIGLIKKILIADVLALFVNAGFNGAYQFMNSIMTILLILSYTLQIYFDFSGYSDMAYGISYMFNIEFPQNFDSPYKALSINDFWKRWHMSLTTFFTKYLYIPLGGNRKGEMRTYINVLIVFTVSGLWHGASITYVIWGLLHGIFSVIERKFKFVSKMPMFLQWIYTFAIVNVLWVFFRSTSLTQAITILKNIFQFNSFSVDFNLLSNMVLPEIRLLLSFFDFTLLLRILPIIFILFLLIICVIFKNTNERFNTYKLNLFNAVLLIFFVSWCVLSFGNKISFIYEMF